MRTRNLLCILSCLFALSACSYYDDSYVDTQIEAYTRAFIREFGLIDPNHTWGFTVDNPTSREVDVNGNEWVQPPAVTDEEVGLVMNYLKEHRSDIPDEPINFTRYFVTQVGGSFEGYDALNGEHFNGSQYMDELAIAERENWTMGMLNDEETPSVWHHCNNFNASANANYNGNTVMYDSGTWRFAYRSTRDSKYHDKYRIVPGSAIDPSLSAYHYVCFDFDSHYGVQTQFRVRYTFIDEGGNPQETEGLVTFEGVYDKDDQTGWPSDQDLLDALGVEGVQSLVNKRWENYQYANKYTEANGVYDDWVVRIVGNAMRINEVTEDNQPDYPTEDNPEVPTYKWKRVMVEDLSTRASFDMSVGLSDWDFNDLVFDATILGDGTAKIRIRALGGTLPIYIADNSGHRTQELHSFFGVDYGITVNTGMGISADAVDISSYITDFTFNPDDYRSIRVIVDDEGHEFEMYAETGHAPSKVCVPTTVAWASERQHITIPYPQFANWVSNMSRTFWDYDTNTNPASSGD